MFTELIGEAVFGLKFIIDMIKNSREELKDNADTETDVSMEFGHRTYDALDIAYYIVDKSIKTKRYINVYTLNFILYLIAEEYYRTTGWSIFYDVIVARNFGPVVGCVYREFVVDIQPITVLFPGWSPKKPIHPEDQALFDRVLYVVTESDYFSVRDEITKKGSAWSIAYPPYSGLCLNFIEPELVKECALKKDCSSIEILENNLKKKA